MSRIEERLAEARRGLHRMTPAEARLAQLQGALLVDTRTPWQRRAQGELPDALIIDRTVLEWRLDPSNEDHIPEAMPDSKVIIICRHGYSSSLAARSLQDLGIDATDVIGGVAAWISDGLALHSGQVDERR
jgi:rhodanese-related sulfurtransferase